MECINFDAQFAQALNRWLEANRARYRDPDALEDASADFYLQWLDAPADWLGGDSPNGFFQRQTDAAALTALLRAYVQEDIPMPDPLPRPRRAGGRQRRFLSAMA